MNHSESTYNRTCAQDCSGQTNELLDSREVFKEAVCWELANGRLSTWRRRRLVQYAAAFQISAVDAGQLIQEAIQMHGEPQAPQASQPDLRITQSADDHWPAWAKLAWAFSLVIVLELALYWLIRT